MSRKVTYKAVAYDEKSWAYGIGIFRNGVQVDSVFLGIELDQYEAQDMASDLNDAYNRGWEDRVVAPDYDAIVDHNLDHEQVEARHKELWML